MDYPHEDHNNGTPGPDERGSPALAAAPPVQLQIKFADNRGNEQAFKLKSTTNITKAMDAFSAKVERPRASLRFLFEGVRLISGTVEENELQDGDLVEVHEEQLGGGDGCCGGKCHCGDKNCDGKCCGGKGGCGGGKGK
ncbi:Putative Ubiquitin-like domain-containing protein [Septoria linicola]|uniref:Ubiquitin-like domain-containing protein n=1 Tax=Septoria linicola TaxID=215465 RepID=A0A9Q9AP61_9PEZI|nr:Putative Ubiquitin-like domain-containing protein [Septoria linicola]